MLNNVEQVSGDGGGPTADIDEPLQRLVVQCTQLLQQQSYLLLSGSLQFAADAYYTHVLAGRVDEM